MNPEQYRQLKQLFMAAFPMEPAERAAFLDEACGDDKELRTQIESIFKYHDPATVIEQGLVFLDPAATTAGSTAAQIPVRGSVEALSPVPGTASPLPAGAMVAGRYRIVDLLGRGGMGQVYRADDVGLGQPVALKFLATGRASDPVWLAYFREEVRLARRVTHPNVCRVHDIGEADGRVFISMEYIDGEDMRSLLRRIGQLPRNKALEVARQMCAGLAAAHEQGVLHRDLKPANIMLDGAGQVKITDFGIASAAPQPNQRLPIAGTPAYIAPEILAGKPPSPQSDIYALGLVCYEMITGRAAFAADTFEQRLREPAPSGLMEIAPETDASLCRLIMQCMQEEPALRPRSVYAVAAGLPGTDPLRMALEAGHTPSPDTIAAAGLDSIRPTAAWGWFAGAVTLLVVVVLLAGTTFLLPRAHLARAPAVLEEQAQRVIRELGRTDETRGRAHGFVVTPTSGGGAEDDSGLAAGEPAVLFFEYHQGERWTPPRGPLAMPPLFDLAWPMPGQRLVRLDPKGRLILYRAAPPATVAAESVEPAAIDWSVPFGLAGLNPAAFAPLRPPATAAVADRHIGWHGPHPDDASRQVIVQAAADGPWVVLFRVWDGQTGVEDVAFVRRGGDMDDAVRFGMFFILLACGAVLAWRNVQQARADRRGAWRLALFMLVVEGVLWAVRPSHRWDLAMEAGLLLTALRFAVFTAVATWIFYIALEPHVRRFWPQSVIGWSRVLLGDVRDPHVGRDVLVGVAAGSAIVLTQQVSVLAARWTGVDPAAAVAPWGGPDLGLLAGFRDGIGTLASATAAAVWLGLAMLLLLLLLRLWIGRAWLAATVFFLVAAAVLTVSWESAQGLPWLTGLAVAVVLAWVLTRAGLLAGMVALLSMLLLTRASLTTDAHAWYAGSMAMVLTIIGGLLVLGLSASLSRRPARG